MCVDTFMNGTILFSPPAIVHGTPLWYFNVTLTGLTESGGLGHIYATSAFVHVGEYCFTRLDGSALYASLFADKYMCDTVIHTSVSMMHVCD